MFQEKVAVIAAVGMLTMSIGLAACSSNAPSLSTDSSSAASSSSEAPASTSSSSTSRDEIAYWEGTLSDGTTVSYYDNAVSGVAILSVTDSKLSNAKVWLGTSGSNADGVVTITDTETKQTISYTISDITPSSMTIDLEGYGEVVLKPITEADFEAYAEGLATTAQAEGKRVLDEFRSNAKKLEKEVSDEVEKISSEFDKLDESTVFFWDGTLADGRSVSYMDDPQSGEAYLSIFKADLSDGTAWYGKCSTDQDGKTVTITDSESGKTISFEITETTSGTSMKIDVEGYGEANLKPVTKGDFTKLAEELAKLK